MAREEILKQAKEFFFKAMLVGWPAGVRGADVHGMPGYKEKGAFMGGSGTDFRLLDRWCVSTCGSAGTIAIWFRDEPIWIMFYGGHYPKEVIPFLKLALMEAYKKDEFLGGRGPRVYLAVNKELRYFNGVIPPSNFSRFEGREEIYVVNSDGTEAEMVGWHKYWGMALI